MHASLLRCVCSSNDIPKFLHVVVNWHRDIHLQMQLLSIPDAVQIISAHTHIAKMGHHTFHGFPTKL